MKNEEESYFGYFAFGLLIGLLIWFFTPNSVSNVNQTKITQAVKQCKDSSFKSIKIYGSFKYLVTQNKVEVKCSNDEIIILEHSAK